MNFNDEAQRIRPGEELDEKKVESFLKDTISGLDGPFSIKQFPSGFSNLTYLVTVGQREMVLRRPPIGANIKSAHDMKREYTIQKSLKPFYPYCPEMLAYTEDESIVGSPFYVMDRLKGIILRKDVPEGMHFSSQEGQQLCEKLLDAFVELHAIDVKEAGLDHLGKPEGYVQRQVDGWSGRYRKAITPDAPDCEVVMAWLAEKMQPDTNRPVIVHNDFRFDNVVLDPEDPMTIIGVLDWEMATHGDPLMDLGNTLAYWVEATDSLEEQMMRVMPTTMAGALTRRELIERYSEKSNRDITRFDFYYCFGLFRLAVIAQQIYNRFYHGITKDERFGLLIAGVQILERSALRVIESSEL